LAILQTGKFLNSPSLLAIGDCEQLSTGKETIL
jgi:hypothetical protein